MTITATCPGNFFVTIALIAGAFSAELLPARRNINPDELFQKKRSPRLKILESIYDGPPDALSPIDGSVSIPATNAEGHALVRSWLGIWSCNSGYFACAFSFLPNPASIVEFPYTLKLPFLSLLTECSFLGGTYCCAMGSCCTTTGCVKDQGGGCCESATGGSCISGNTCCAGFTCIPTTNDATYCLDRTYCTNSNIHEKRGADLESNPGDNPNHPHYTWQVDLL
jgi:hypothetical protein